MIIYNKKIHFLNGDNILLRQQKKLPFVYKYQSFKVNMYNFWSPLLYFGYNFQTLRNNSFQHFLFSTSMSNQLVLQANRPQNQILPGNTTVKLEDSQHEQPKEPSHHNQVKIEEVIAQNEVQNSQNEQGEQGNLTKMDLVNLKGSYQKLKWSQQDDNILIDLYDNQGKKMHEVAHKFEGASEKMCMTRYKRLKKTQLKYWTREEDNIVKNTVAQIGQKWKEISKLLPNRTAKQIREHYINSLRPLIKKTPWTPQQDMMVNKLVKQKGKQWRLFQKILIGRTENHIKNRYYGRIKKIEEIKKNIQSHSNQY